MKYAGFWRRALSLFIDIALTMTVYILFWKFLYGISTLVALTGTLVLLILAYTYEMYFLSRWGQTIGKMIAKIKITKLNGEKIKFTNILRRCSVNLLLSGIAVYGFIISYTSIDNSIWTSISFNERNLLVVENNPTGSIYNIISQCWVLSELLVLLFNKKKRALHDYIAKTVVIHAPKQSNINL